MTKDEIIKLAQASGINFQEHVGVLGRPNTTTLGSLRIELIEAFALACYEAGRTAERDDIAKLEAEKIGRSMP